MVTRMMLRLTSCTLGMQMPPATTLESWMLKLSPTKKTVVPSPSQTGSSFGTMYGNMLPLASFTVTVCSCLFASMYVSGPATGARPPFAHVVVHPHLKLLVPPSVTLMPGAPYQPINSGARSVTPVLNISKPPRVFSYGTSVRIDWSGNSWSSWSTRFNNRPISLSRYMAAHWLHIAREFRMAVTARLRCMLSFIVSAAFLGLVSAYQLVRMSKSAYGTNDGMSTMAVHSRSPASS